MAKVTYKLQYFDNVKAKDGSLCVMVLDTIQPGTKISTIDNSGNKNPNIVGAGICRYLGGDSYALTIDSVEYLFNEEGVGNYPSSSGYKLLLGVAELNLSVSGIASKSNNTTTTTRGTDGSISTEIDYSKSSDVLVESLNARDEFAISALRELLSHTTKPSEMSDSEMNYYCNAAYRWAANMMAASADARGSFTNASSGDSGDSGDSGSTTTPSEPTRGTDVDSNTLTSNTEKILNNISIILGRTDVSNSNIYSKRVRVQFQELTDLLKAYVKDSSSTENKTVGLSDLIAAIKGIGSTSSSSTDQIDTRIKKWLEKTTIVSDDNGGHKLSVPSSVSD